MPVIMLSLLGDTGAKISILSHQSLLRLSLAPDVEKVELECVLLWEGPAGLKKTWLKKKLKKKIKNQVLKKK